MQAAWLWPVYELLPRLWEWGWLHEDWTPPHSTSNWTPCSFNVLHSCIKFMSYLQLVNEGFPWKISVYECLLCTASVNFTWTDVPGKPMKKSSPASGKWKHHELQLWVREFYLSTTTMWWLAPCVEKVAHFAKLIISGMLLLAKQKLNYTRVRKTHQALSDYTYVCNSM